MGIINKIGVFLGISDEIEDEYEMDRVDDFGEPSDGRSNKVVRIYNGKVMRIAVYEPKSYEEAPLIVEDIKMRKAVIVNFENLEATLKRQIFDFVNGGLYAIEGKIQKVTKDIFIMAPSNVEIEGLKEELKSKGVFPW